MSRDTEPAQGYRDNAYTEPKKMSRYEHSEWRGLKNIFAVFWCVVSLLWKDIERIYWLTKNAHTPDTDSWIIWSVAQIGITLWVWYILWRVSWNWDRD